MKASSLLFSLPLLLSALAAMGLPPGDVSTSPSTAITTRPPGGDVKMPAPTDGPWGTGKFSSRGVPSEEVLPDINPGEIMTIRTRGRKIQFEVMKDMYHVRSRDGTESVVRVPESRSVADIVEYASLREFETGDRADIIAFKTGRPRTEGSKVLITKKVTVLLADGVTPSVFASSLGALRKERFSIANEALILTYASATEAIEAVELLRDIPGVLSAENMLAVKRAPEMIPTNVRYFERGAGPEYRPFPWTDVLIHWQHALIRNTSAYQWWANNQVNPAAVFDVGDSVIGPGPWSSPPATVWAGDYLPLEYNPLTPQVNGEQADLRLPVVWETLGDFDLPISGRGRKIAILDDGIQKSQPDLQLAFDLNPTHHWNYFTDTADPNPLAPTDTHGTSLAGFAGARLKITGSRIVGVAPGCQFQSQVVLKGYVDDIHWAQAFAPGSVLKDSDEDNDLLDEERGSLTYTEIILNASTINGTQDAVDLYPEEWLWRRAIGFGSTRGRETKGVIYITSAGNGAEGHMNTNYIEQKNSIYQIPIGSISDHGRQLAYSVKGCNLVGVGLSGTDELVPIIDWPGAPPNWPASLPTKANAPVEAEDIPYPWRRISSGVPTIATQNSIDFDFTGTSASAAQVAGIVALMLEANPTLKARDVKEILLRSGRVCNDVRTTHDDKLWPTTWRMSVLGVPLHYSFGAGLIDANRAVQIAKGWPPLPFNPLTPRKINLESDDLTKISNRNTETGGQYFPVPAGQLIPVDGRTIEIILFSPPSGMRLEHIDVRVQFFHQRRGDLEITLIAPPELGWETGKEMESELYVPHREDYQESRWHNTEEALRDPTDWTFSTIRHWGTRIPAGGGGQWKLRIRDAIDRGTNPGPPPNGEVLDLGNPVGVPVANPTDVQSQRLAGVGITYHGTFGHSLGNDAPEVTSDRFVFSPGNTIDKSVLRVGELGTDSTGTVRFPITSWDFFNTRDIVPPHATQTAHEPFEYFPPAFRDPAAPPDLDPPDLLPIEDFGLAWPSQPFTALNPPLWISFAAPNPNNLVPPTTGSSGGMTSWPLWGPIVNGEPTRMERSVDRTFMVLRDSRNTDNQTNFIFVRLNRKKGELEVVPFNVGIYNVQIYAENLIGKSRPKTLEFVVTEPLDFESWRDIWWNAPEVTDEAISGWLADPDVDGLENGLEFMMRMNPTLFDSSGIPLYRIEGNEVVFNYQQDISVVGGILHAQVSEDLQAWADVTPVEVRTIGNIRVWEVRIPLGDERIFFRLWAEDDRAVPVPPAP